MRSTSRTARMPMTRVITVEKSLSIMPPASQVFKMLLNCSIYVSFLRNQGIPDRILCIIPGFYPGCKGFAGASYGFSQFARGKL